MYPRDLQQQPGQNNRLGNAALVLGILSVVLCWTVGVGLLFGVLGVVFGRIGRGRAERGEATNGRAARAGAVVGGIGIGLTVAFTVAIAVYH
jgi:hypothetical protein